MTEQQQQVTAGSWLDNFVEYVKQALEIIQLKPEAIDRARQDDEAFTMGLVIIALGGVAAAIGSINPFGVIFLPVMFIIAAFIFVAIVHLMATLVFKGEGEFLELFRPLGLAHVLTWVNVIWILNVILGPLAGLWMLVVAVVCVERTYKLDRGKAIAAVAIPVAVLFLIVMMFVAMVGMAIILGLRGAG
jgi:hypothetical protein